MPQAILTIELLKTEQVFTETFDDNMSGVAWMLAHNRAKELQRDGYQVNNPDDSQSFHPCVTTIAEG